MKKVLWGGIAIIVLLLVGYALWSASRSAQPVTSNPNGQTSVPSETTNPGTTVSTGQYKDGTYTGSVGSAAPYGQVQVSVTVSGGKIASVQMLQKPQGPEETNAVTARAFPLLVQEAITAQSANVNIVSGATQDSQGFKASLSSALAQAQN